MQDHAEYLKTFHPHDTYAKCHFGAVCRSPELLEKFRTNDHLLAVYNLSDPESDAAPGCSYVESLTHQLDTNLLASGVLFSPFHTMARLPGVATIPVLRTIGSLGHVLVATSFATSAIFRLRLKLLKDPARRESFAEEFHRAQSEHWSLKYITASSPLVLTYGSIMLFLVLLSGWTVNPGPIQGAPSPYQAGQIELVIFICAIVCGIANCGLALRTAFLLGRRPQI